MKKRGIGIVMVVMCGYTQTFANDCGLVNTGNLEAIINNFNSANYTKYHKFMIPEGFAQAVTNLKTHCCTKKLITCTEAETKNFPKEEKYPQSDYLFDHLIDITMRRLDGEKTLAYNLDVDPMAEKRRTIIKDLANKENGIPASIIQWDFVGYWTLNKKKTRNLEIVLKNYNTTDTWTLSMADKYDTVCELSKMLYKELQKDTKVIIGEYNEPKSFFKKCTNMVKDRVQRESVYVKILMIQKSTQILDESTKAYTKKHFVEEKLMALWSLISKVKDTFQTIIQQSAASKTCSK